MKKNGDLYFEEWVDRDNGYAIFQEVDARGFPMEFVLVRGIFEETDGIMQASSIKEIFTSKFKQKLYKAFASEKQKKGYIMNVEETIKNLTIPQLKSLLPSYYQYVIERRIKELEEKELQAKPVEESLAQPQVKKSRKKNADSSTKRKSKKTTKTTSRE